MNKMNLHGYNIFKHGKTKVIKLCKYHKGLDILYKSNSKILTTCNFSINKNLFPGSEKNNTWKIFFFYSGIQHVSAFLENY